MIEGFDKPGIWVVFNAGTNMKPQHSQLCEDFIFVTRPKTGKITVLQSLLI